MILSTSNESNKPLREGLTNCIAGPRQESRLIVDELNSKVEEARAKGVEDDTTKRRANEATKGNK